MVALRTNSAGFPMAPSAEEWVAISPAERAAVVAALPGEVTYDEMAMPEGDRHFQAKVRALDALRGFFRRQRRRGVSGRRDANLLPGRATLCARSVRGA